MPQPVLPCCLRLPYRLLLTFCYRRHPYCTRFLTPTHTCVELPNTHLPLPLPALPDSADAGRPDNTCTLCPTHRQPAARVYAANRYYGPVTAGPAFATRLRTPWYRLHHRPCIILPVPAVATPTTTLRFPGYNVTCNATCALPFVLVYRRCCYRVTDVCSCRLPTRLRLWTRSARHGNDDVWWWAWQYIRRAFHYTTQLPAGSLPLTPPVPATFYPPAHRATHYLPTPTTYPTAAHHLCLYPTPPATACHHLPHHGSPPAVPRCCVPAFTYCYRLPPHAPLHAATHHTLSQLHFTRHLPCRRCDGR